MAWGTSPRTWADGDIMTEALLNAELKDKLNALEQHGHGGGNGDGASGLTAVDTITFTDQGSDPSDPASGKTVIYSKAGLVYYRAAGGAVTPLGALVHASRHNSGGGDAMAAGAAAGTPSLRDIGTGALEGAAGNHTHALTEIEDNSPADLGPLTGSAQTFHGAVVLGVTTEVTAKTASMTVNAGSNTLIGVGSIAVIRSGAGAATCTIRLKYDGTTKESTSYVFSDGVAETYLTSLSHLEANPTAASHTWTLTIQFDDVSSTPSYLTPEIMSIEASVA